MSVHRNTSALWGAAFARALGDAGAAHAVVSPGSRSTPLALALALEPRIAATPVLDERTAAFIALGIGRATLRPAILVCTSGTAAANHLPAVAEAWHSQVPMLVCTADRPPELRDCGAGQTIEQHGIHGPRTVWACEAPEPSASAATLEEWRRLLFTAWRRALGKDGAAHPGPVHVNIPLREPLAPATDEPGFSPQTLPPAETAFDETPDNAPPSPHDAPQPDEILEWAARYEHGVIVAGAAAPRDQARYAAAALALAEATGWPLLADALNPARHRAGNHATAADAATNAVVCASYDAILRRNLAPAPRPDAVLQLDLLPTSKTLRTWLAAAPLPTLLLSPGGKNLNPLHTNHRILPHSVADFDWSRYAARNESVLCEPFTAKSHARRATANTAWSHAWRTAETTTAAALAHALDNNTAAAPTAAPAATSSLFEGHAARILALHLPDNAAVLIANSTPARDAEFFWPAQNTHRQIHANRGANGIDGTLGTALGIAAATPAPTFLLTGDLSLLHDSNALLAARDFPGSLTVVLLNNNGGGIFNALDVSRDNPHFERFWATPQNVDFSLLAAAHGVSFERIDNWARLAAAVSEPPHPGTRIIEIPTNRAASALLRPALLSAQ